VPVSIRDAQNSPTDQAWIQRHYHEYLDNLSRLSMNTGLFLQSVSMASANRN
jgi:hypothetical protein